MRQYKRIWARDMAPNKGVFLKGRMYAGFSFYGDVIESIYGSKEESKEKLFWMNKGILNRIHKA